MRSNKWNISWQVARVRAKKIKDIQMRVDFMHEWLLIHNFRVNIDRIAIWLRMSMMSANYESTIIYKKDIFETKAMYDSLQDFYKYGFVIVKNIPTSKNLNNILTMV